MTEQTRTRMTGPERRAAILKAAASTFAQLGYRGATTADIAAAAGITQPMLYRHFTSKHELFLEVLDHFTDPLIEMWQDATDLFVMGSRYLAFSATNQEVLRLRFHALAEAEDPAIRERLRQAFGRLIDAVRTVVCRMGEEGRLPEGASVDAVTWLFSSIGQMVDIGVLLGPEELQGANAGGYLFARMLQSTTKSGLLPLNPAGPASE